MKTNQWLVLFVAMILTQAVYAQELNWEMTSWIIHEGQGTIALAEKAPEHGASMLYNYASIPTADDPGWRAPNADELRDGNVWYNKSSTVKCFEEADFTYLQTRVFVPANAQIEQFEVKFDRVDDGVRAYVTNSQHWEISDPAADFKLGQANQTGDLSRFIVVGEYNWIDLVQVDDCASQNNLENARIAVKLSGGAALEVVPVTDIDVTRTPWILHEGSQGVINLASPVPSHGDASLYNSMMIPEQYDAGWRVPTSDETDTAGNIVYTKTSNLSSCFNQADFTYIQSIIHVPAGVTPTNVTVGFDKVDDGARAYVFNSTYPNGFYAEGTGIVLGGAPQTGEFSSLLVQGDNRIVIVQVDDCPTENNLVNAQIFVDGKSVKIGAPAQ